MYIVFFLCACMALVLDLERSANAFGKKYMYTCYYDVISTYCLNLNHTLELQCPLHLTVNNGIVTLPQSWTHVAFNVQL